MSKRLGWLVLSAALMTAAACTGPGEEAAAPDPELQGPDLFEEVSDASGLRFTYRNGEDTSPHLAILESLGGGVALLDYDGDGLLDVFLPGGGHFDGPGQKQIKGHPCKLFKNLGGWKFKDVTREVGLDRLAGGQPWFYTHAAAVADFNRDGWPDLLVTGWGRVALFRNVPDGQGGRRFVDVSARAGLDKGIRWATSAGFADLDGDGWPDLYVCQYVDWDLEKKNPKHQYDGQTFDVAPPRSFDGLQHKVYRNNGNGTFTDVSDEAGLDRGGPGGKGLGVLLIDVNLDGKPDVFVANDTVPKFLYVNRSTRGKIRLDEKGLPAGVSLDGAGSPNGSMGVDAGDPDGSGLPWLWCTNYENELHGLYRNLSREGEALFLYATPASGIAAIGQKYVGWGTGFLDLDHHGWEDLVIANGHAIRYPTGTTRRQKPVLLRNWNGKFKDITPRGGPYFCEAHLGRGVALGDLDNDGKIDAVVSHMNEPVAVLRNVAPAGHHWLGVDLRGAGHADVVGARVTLEAGGRKQTRFARGGGSYASAPDRRLVFGLGKADRVEKLSVIWPDGKRQEWTGLGIDRYHVLVQGKKAAR
jgi:enediyne biosynthesis protein E4